MKKIMVISILLVGLLLPMSGCATLSGGGKDWRDNVPQLKSNVFLMAKLATRLALVEADMSVADVEVVSNYLTALQEFLTEPYGDTPPRFDAARSIVQRQLPGKYVPYGLAIIDVLERYLEAANLDPTEDQELIFSIINAGIEGALEAVQEFGQ